MPKVLTEAQIRSFETQGFFSPVRVMSPERARGYRERFESLEKRHTADIKKMKTKSHLLCPWVLEIAEDPHILDVFGDLIGPDLRCWSMAWRVKNADGQTLAGWHQDSAYGAAVPVVLGAPRAVGLWHRSGMPARHSWIAHVGHPQARGERRSSQHPGARSVHLRQVRRIDGRGLRAEARRDGDVHQLARARIRNEPRGRTVASCSSSRCCRRGRSRRESVNRPCSSAAATRTATSMTSRGPMASLPRPRSPAGPAWSTSARSSSSRTAAMGRARRTAADGRPHDIGMTSDGRRP